MSRKCIIISILFFICVSGINVSAQNRIFDNHLFYQHLLNENLTSEREYFMRLLIGLHPDEPKVLDTLWLNLAQLYYAKNDVGQASMAVSQISDSVHFSFSQKKLFYSLCMVTDQIPLASEHIFREDRETIFSPFIGDLGISIVLLKHTPVKRETKHGEINSALIAVQYEKLINTPHPSPVLTGLCSTILPGSGKWYLGYRKQALSAFATDILLGAQCAESYYRGGWKTPRFIISASFFTVFYTGNILGSILAARKKRKDYLLQIDHEIYNYYRPFILHPGS